MIRATPARQTGLTLVELMIGVGIGLFVTLVIIQIFTEQKTSFRVQEGMARVQENARLALDFLGRDARSAGYTGCAKNQEPANIAKPVGSSWVSFNNAVTGYSAASLPPGLASTEVLAGTDVIMFQYADNLNASLTGNLGTVNANIQITQNPNNVIQTDDILFITNCAYADVFRANSVSQGGGTVTITHSSASNIGNNLSTTYQADSQLMRLATNIYFVACMDNNNPTSVCSADGPYYLWRKVLSGPNLVAQDLVEGVENMRIQYGEDVDGNSVADKYVDFDDVGDWSRVVSINLSLLLRTIEDRLSSTTQTYTYDGNSVTATDRRIRRAYTTTLDLRNRTY